MSKATVTFEDTPQGTVQVTLEFDPEISPRHNISTPTQAFALHVLRVAQKGYDEDPDEQEDEQAAPGSSPAEQLAKDLHDEFLQRGQLEGGTLL